MFKILLVVLAIGIPVICFIFKLRIDFKSFLRRGIKCKRGDFGIYCFSGSQGNGKTVSLITYLFNLNPKKSIIFCNIPNIRGLRYHFYSGFNELMAVKQCLDNKVYDTTNKQIVIVFDELFLELQRGSKINSEVMDFLCQMRKRKIIFLTSCQYWSELPITYRRFCRYQIDCKMLNFRFLPLVPSLVYNRYRDAENMKWDELEQDFVAPLISTTIFKASKRILNSYNTLERIEIKSS